MKETRIFMYYPPIG